MDVTFFENKPFYPISDIQGENMSEYLSWENLLESLPTPSNPTIVPVVPIDPLSPIPDLGEQNQGSIKETPEHSSQLPVPTSELRVYTRRKRNQEEIQPAQPQETHESQPNLTSENMQGTTTTTDLTNNDLELPIALRKGVRTCTSHPIQNFVSYKTLSTEFSAFLSKIDPIQVPTSIHEALNVPEWKAATLEEINALEKNETWEITSLPPGKCPVGCKWIFSVKHKADGSIERFKARLVAKGYTQSYGIDYEETFAPVAKLNTIRVILSLAANLDLPLHQLDIKNAFLNADLEEEVYMEIPPGFGTKETVNKVCKLRKALYGLKQSPRAWFDRFSKVLKKNGFTQCQADHTLFVKHSTNKTFTILIVYVDDIVLTGNNGEEISQLKKLLSSEFEVKDLGNMRYFLGMEVARSKEGIVISQRKYVIDLLNETGMMGCKPADTPMDPYNKIGTKKDSAPVDRGRYQRLVGRLIYLSHTRPDIGFSVSVISQFMNNPTEEHMEAALRVLRYLKSTPGKGLIFKKNSNRGIEVFTDADWAGSIMDRRSTSGYCTFVWGNLVTWRSKKQSVVARSSAEAEFRAMAHGICEGIWLRRLLSELKVKIPDPIKLLCDNQAAISIAKNPVHHDRTKHIEVDRHFISEKIESKVINLVYTPSQQQNADILTKALHRPTFEDLSSKLGMLNIYYPA